MKNNDAQMLELKSTLVQISHRLKSRNVIYLDYPIHTNGGDLLILLGTLQFFQDFNINVEYSASFHNVDFDKIKQVLTSKPDTTIVLHGGGNFGDLYFHHQNLRTEVFKRFKEANIVLFPQTAHYKDPQKTIEDKKLTSMLKSAHFLARDTRTLKIFEELGVSTSLCPDIAHQLYGSFPMSNAIKKQTLFFLRKDIEKSGSHPNEAEAIDWIDLLSWFDKKIIRFVVHLQKRTNLMSSLSYQFWCWYAKRLMQKMAREFCKYSDVTTSRLHGHIFSCLLSLDNHVIDNSYGKNSRYIRLWTNKVECFKTIETTISD